MKEGMLQPTVPPLAPWASVLQRTEKYLYDLFSADTGETRTLVNYLFDAGGKRIRPALVILSADVFGRVTGKVLALAAVMEAVHVASLLHDDVVDNGGTRRGHVAVRADWNNKVAVILADLILSRSMETVAREFRDVAFFKEIIKTTNCMAAGQLLEMENVGNSKLAIDEYLKVIEGKTAVLFSSCCRLGAMAAGAGKADIKKIAGYGLYLGMAFQVCDDYLDYWGNEEVLGKPVGNDLTEGKVTLPLILALEKVNDADKEFLKSMIGKKKMSRKSFRKVLRIMESVDVRKAVRGKADSYTAGALSMLSGLRGGKAVEGLKELAGFLAGRSG
ncbi:MAG: polyprenyl synthetase family protein [Chloroflexi bacterium]|nr:polyprenyl synthetase family protein [Chloroflexota bacterium]